MPDPNVETEVVDPEVADDIAEEVVAEDVAEEVEGDPDLSDLDEESRALYEELEGYTSKQLVEFYNDRVEPSIKKFSSKEVGLARCREILTAKPGEELPDPEAAVVPEEGGEEAAEVELSNRSKGVKASWLDPDIAAKRKERSRVSVDGVVYASVPAAFRALGLDQKGMIPFRMELKAREPDPTGEIYGLDHGFHWQIMPMDTPVTSDIEPEEAAEPTEDEPAEVPEQERYAPEEDRSE